MNWRIVVKNYVKGVLNPVYVDSALTKGVDTLTRFDYWNNQNKNLTDQTEGVPRFSMYFEWSFIGAEKQFTRQTNLKSASFIPVQFTIHILLTNFSVLEDATDQIYEYAYAVKSLLDNTQHELFTRRLELVKEVADIRHGAHLEHQITFKTVVKDKAEATDEVRDIAGETIAIGINEQITHTDEDISITATIVSE